MRPLFETSIHETWHFVLHPPSSPGLPPVIWPVELRRITSSACQQGHRLLEKQVWACASTREAPFVVETGVLYGHSSAAILAGLEDNGSGKLISIDLPPDQHRSVIVEGQYLQVGLSSNELSVGCAVPPKIRSRWTLQLGNSLELLPKILKQFAPISMFVHDSLHTYDHMIAEFRLGYDMLEPGGLLISDDIGYNLAWHDFCRSRKEEWKEFSKGSDKNDRFGFLIKSSS